MYCEIYSGRNFINYLAQIINVKQEVIIAFYTYGQKLLCSMYFKDSNPLLVCTALNMDIYNSTFILKRGFEG